MRDKTFSGICLVNGVVVLGLYKAEKQLDDKCEWITVAGRTKQVLRIREQIGARLVAHRQDGVQFLCTRRTSLFVSPKRLYQMERKHRAEFKFLSIAVVNPRSYQVCGKDWLSLTKGERLKVCAAIARDGVYAASDTDLPAALFAPPPSTAVPAAPTPAPAAPTEDDRQLVIGRIALGLVAVLVTFALLGLGHVVVVAAYSILAACIVAIRSKSRLPKAEVPF